MPHAGRTRLNVGGTGCRGMFKSLCKTLQLFHVVRVCKECLTPPASDILKFGTTIQGGFMHNRCTFGVRQPDKTGAWGEGQESRVGGECHEYSRASKLSGT